MQAEAQLLDWRLDVDVKALQAREEEIANRLSTLIAALSSAVEAQERPERMASDSDYSFHRGEDHCHPDSRGVRADL